MEKESIKCDLGLIFTWVPIGTIFNGAILFSCALKLIINLSLLRTLLAKIGIHLLINQEDLIFSPFFARRVADAAWSHLCAFPSPLPNVPFSRFKFHLFCTHHSKRRVSRWARCPSAACSPRVESCRSVSAWRAGICWRCCLQRHPMIGTPAGTGSWTSLRKAALYPE